MQTFGTDPLLDGAVLKERCISITPVKCDMTDYQALEDLKSWNLDLIVKSSREVDGD
jgi:5'-nucleotidase